MSQYEQVMCPLCGSSKNSPLYANREVSYTICDVCTLVFLNPRPTEGSYKEFYDEEYQAHRHGLTDYADAVKRLSSGTNYEKKKTYLPDIAPYLKKETRVLEVGAGWGSLLKLVQNTYGSSVEGVEISELASRVARDYYKLPVSHETFDEFFSKYDDKLFDVIIMTHVLEHITDLAGALLKLSKLLSEGGVLYLAVPNVFRPFEPLERFFHAEHCYYFSPLTLTRLLGQHGFTVRMLRTDTIDIRVVAAKSGVSDSAEMLPELGRRYSQKMLRRTLAMQRYKYATLRALTSIVRAIVPQGLFFTLRKWGIRLLKKIRVIDV